MVSPAGEQRSCCKANGGHDHGGKGEVLESNGVFFRARYLSNGKNKLTICQDRLGTHRRRTFAFTQESLPQRCAYVEYSFGVALDPELPGTEGGVFQSFKTIGADCHFFAPFCVLSS